MRMPLRFVVAAAILLSVDAARVRTRRMPLRDGTDATAAHAEVDKDKDEFIDETADSSEVVESIDETADPSEVVKDYRPNHGDEEGVVFYVTGDNKVEKYTLDHDGVAVAWPGKSIVLDLTNKQDPNDKSQITWAVKFQNHENAERIAFTIENKNQLVIFDPRNSEHTLVDLQSLCGGLQQPVGACFANKTIYLSMFAHDDTPPHDGDDGSEINTSGGVCVIDVSKDETISQNAVKFYQYPLEADPASNFKGQHLVHNVVSFEQDSRQEIFINDIGNPWSNPIVPGKGLVHVDELTREFNPVIGIDATEKSFDNELKQLLGEDEFNKHPGIHARSSTQSIDDSSLFYVLTQNPNGQPSSLFAMKHYPSEATIHSSIIKSLTLPERGVDAGEGGADVISLGRNMVLVTDRFGPTASGGKMYLYDLKKTSVTPDSTWTLHDNNPRHTAIVGNSVVSASNKGPGLMTIFKDLLTKHTDSNSGTVYYTVNSTPQEGQEASTLVTGTSFILAVEQESGPHVA